MSCRLGWDLEAESRGELDLAVRAQSHRRAHRGGQQAERAAGRRLREGLAGLDLVRARAQRVVETPRRERVVVLVEQIEDLEAQVEPRAVAGRDTLDQHQVELPEARAPDRAALQVAELAGGRDGESGRVEPLV